MLWEQYKSYRLSSANPKVVKITNIIISRIEDSSSQDLADTKIANIIASIQELMDDGLMPQREINIHNWIVLFDSWIFRTYWN